MAEASVKFAEPVCPPVESVTLTLTGEEASALLALAPNIGGYTGGPRGKCDEVFKALWDAGIQPVTNRMDGVLYFRD